MVRLILSVVAVALFSALILAGCGSKDDDDDVSGGIVCADGELWEEDDGSGGEALIFRSNNEVYNTILGSDGIWHAGKIGTWSMNGNQVIITDGEDYFTLTLKGNRLSGGNDGDLVKKSGKNIVFH
jgi:hypothetical protein